MTAVTGLVDAVSYLGLGRIFTANMTGNVVIMAFAAAKTPGLSILRSVVALILFLSGAVAGGCLANTLQTKARRTWVTTTTGLESSLLFIAALVAYADSSAPLRDVVLYSIIVLTAFAMGLRNSTIRRLAIRELTTTVLTLTLAGLAADSSLAGGTNPNWRRRGGSVIMLFLGALAGALLLRQSLFYALLAPALITGLCTLLLYLHLAPAKS
ncbi:MAG TPA: YoaK family protein [Bryobacteraceae bacterium]|nr:YoaK family protein [Bryobacteraceae bacterium]